MEDYIGCKDSNKRIQPCFEPLTSPKWLQNQNVILFMRKSVEKMCLVHFLLPVSCDRILAENHDEPIAVTRDHSPRYLSCSQLDGLSLFWGGRR